jgi:hypothetical protein
MTHKEQLIQIFKEAGVTAHQNYEAENSLCLESDTPGVHGYIGFCATLRFDADGKLIDVGIYE